MGKGHSRLQRRTGNYPLIGRDGNCSLMGACLIMSRPIALLYNLLLDRFIARHYRRSRQVDPPRGSHRDYFARVTDYAQK